jgi:hypothetical protein
MIEHIVSGLFLLWLAVDAFWVLYNMPAAKKDPFLFTADQESRLERLDRELALLDCKLVHPTDPTDWAVKKQSYEIP